MSEHTPDRTEQIRARLAANCSTGWSHDVAWLLAERDALLARVEHERAWAVDYRQQRDELLARVEAAEQERLGVLAGVEFWKKKAEAAERAGAVKALRDFGRLNGSRDAAHTADEIENGADL